MSVHATYPVRMDAHLEAPLSRWLWLVKWFLAIPHYIVLAFLWAAFLVLSVAAFFSILFTGRYPRSVFEFNVGVLRWTWRVSYYAYGALGTDRYPPFTLEEVPDYPTHLAITYPEELSRGLVLVKWWLLAIPHYVIVALLAGGAWIAGEWAWPATGLIGILVLIAAVILAFTGRYPQSLFDLILGLNRWVLRVAAYAGLMTDVYPPFRLDMGGDEPAGTLTVPQPPAPEETPPGAPPRAVGWSGGRIAAVVIGVILSMASLGVLIAGGVTLWADKTQRDAAGYLTSAEERFATSTFAITSEDISLDLGGASFAGTFLGDVRVRVRAADPATEIFIGIAPASAVDAYLGGVEHAIAGDFADGTKLTTVPGGSPATPPRAQTFWTVSSEGAGQQTLVWPIRSGDWTLVTMDADGRRSLEVFGDVGANFPALPWVATGLLAGGALLMIISGFLVVVPVARAGRRA